MMNALNVDALVIGGGITGMQAALDLGNQGYQVALVEKEPSIGGKMITLSKVFPTLDCCSCITTPKMSAVAHHPNIHLLAYCEVQNVQEGKNGFAVSVLKKPRYVDESLYTGRRQCEYECPITVPSPFDRDLGAYRAIRVPFSTAVPQKAVLDIDNCLLCGKCERVCPVNAVDFMQQPETLDLKTRTILLATGFNPYKPYKGDYGYGELLEVVTLPEFLRHLALLKEGRPLLWNGQPVRDVAIMHCVGSRQIEGIDEPQPDGQIKSYCSRVCCTASIHIALDLRTRFPAVNVYDLYQDIRTYGRNHEEYYRLAQDAKVRFFRYTGEERPFVLPAPERDTHPVLVQVKDTLTYDEEIEVPVDLVILAVGMMPHPIDDLVQMLKISRGNDRFLVEVHPKLRPVEMSVNGIFLAGTDQSPMNIQESLAAASAAATNQPPQQVLWPAWKMFWICMSNRTIRGGPKSVTMNGGEH